MFAALYGLETLTLRYFNVFGPRQDPGSPYSGVISLFMTALLAGRTPVIYGDGRQSRDFTYVANVVDGEPAGAQGARAWRASRSTWRPGRAITLRQLLASLAPRDRRPGEGDATGRPAPGDIRHSLADIRLARKLLGYRPIVDFETGLRRTVEWYRSAHRG